MSTPDAAAALDAIDRILNRGGDADDILRQVVETLHERAGYGWAGILFVEEGRLELGPHAGEPDESRRTSVPVLWQGEPVARLEVDGAAAGDHAFLERVAVLVSAHCLVGWDTGGEPWDS